MHYGSRIFSFFKWSLTKLLKEDSYPQFKVLFRFKFPCDSVCGQRVWSDSRWGSVSGWVGGERRSRAVELNSLKRTLFGVVLGEWELGVLDPESDCVGGSGRPLMRGQWPEALRRSPGRSVWTARPHGRSQSPGSWPWRAVAGGWGGEEPPPPGGERPLLPGHTWSWTGASRLRLGPTWTFPAVYPSGAHWGGHFQSRGSFSGLYDVFSLLSYWSKDYFLAPFFGEQTLNCIKNSKNILNSVLPQTNGGTLWRTQWRHGTADIAALTPRRRQAVRRDDAPCRRGSWEGCGCVCVFYGRNAVCVWDPWSHAADFRVRSAKVAFQIDY